MSVHPQSVKWDPFLLHAFITQNSSTTAEAFSKGNKDLSQIVTNTDIDVTGTCNWLTNSVLGPHWNTIGATLAPSFLLWLKHWLFVLYLCKKDALGAATAYWLGIQAWNWRVAGLMPSQWTLAEEPYSITLTAPKVLLQQAAHCTGLVYVSLIHYWDKCRDQIPCLCKYTWPMRLDLSFSSCAGGVWGSCLLERIRHSGDVGVR